MGYNFFKIGDQMYHVSSYFFRIEFQQRGAPHLHSLLWLQNEKNENAPSFWSSKGDNKSDDDREISLKVSKKLSRKKAKLNVERENLIFVLAHNFAICVIFAL